MNLLQLSKAIQQAFDQNHAVLVYGPSKAGKTRLVGTAAQIDEFETIYWIDIENGFSTLLHMGLTDEQLAKIQLIKIQDTRDNPLAIETILKTFTSTVPLDICEKHGQVNCAICKKANASFFKWHLRQCKHNDLVVIDSGSQLGDSALGAACLGKPDMFKPTFDEYGMVNKWLGDIMSVVQQATYTNFVVITHEIALEDDEGKDRIFPLMGSKQFSMKCGKYFGTVAYASLKLNKHVAGSGSTYKLNTITGSRVNALLEKTATPSMRDIFVQGGILKPGGGLVQQEVPRTSEVASPIVPPVANSAKPGGLAARLAARNQSPTA